MLIELSDEERDLIVRGLEEMRQHFERYGNVEHIARAGALIEKLLAGAGPQTVPPEDQPPRQKGRPRKVPGVTPETRSDVQAAQGLPETRSEGEAAPEPTRKKRR